MIACDLCALDCGSKPFELATPDRTLNFCCEGCRGIYMMLNEIKEPPDFPAQTMNAQTDRSGT
jgi:hypothetical protein